MRILSRLKTIEQVLIPYWILVFAFLEWSYNNQMEHRTFGSAMFLMIWTFQTKSDDILLRWFLNALRVVVMAGMIMIAHKNLFFDTLTLLGF